MDEEIGLRNKKYPQDNSKFRDLKHFCMTFKRTLDGNFHLYI